MSSRGGSREAEIFDPAREVSSGVGQMNDNWHYMTETKLRDGSVVLAGGDANNEQGTAQTRIYRR
jgi:hypothetical protein